MIGAIFFLAGMAFIAYAVATQYPNTPVTDSAPQRVWAAVVAAAASIGTAVWAWVQGWGS